MDTYLKHIIDVIVRYTAYCLVTAPFDVQKKC
jgi:hypothetical protein